MHITTTVRMDLNDVQDAVLSLIQDKMDISDDADVDIYFDAESDVFVIEIDESKSVSPEPEKKTRRKRRTKAEIEAEKEAASIMAEPVKEQAKEKDEAEEAPFDTKEEVVKEPEPEIQKEANVSIFPDVKSSAPTPEEEPAPVETAKSLFANLTKP